MKKNQQRRKALVYHAKPKPGKTEVVPTKSYRTQRDLALAYSPGVAIPCQEIEKQLENIYNGNIPLTIFYTCNVTSIQI